MVNEKLELMLHMSVLVVVLLLSVLAHAAPWEHQEESAFNCASMVKPVDRLHILVDLAVTSLDPFGVAEPPLNSARLKDRARSPSLATPPLFALLL
jgi:hypothetical protein